MAREAVASLKDTEFSIDLTMVLMDLAEVLRLADRPEEAASTVRDALHLYERKEDVVSAGKARKLIEELTDGATA